MEISKYFEFVNNKSNKFWKIVYNPDFTNNHNKIKYTTTYGSRDKGKKAASTTKDGTLEQIEKLIKSKEDKGYVEVAEEYNVSFFTKKKEVIARNRKTKKKKRTTRKSKKKV